MIIYWIDLQQIYKVESFRFQKILSELDFLDREVNQQDPVQTRLTNFRRNLQFLSQKNDRSIDMSARAPIFSLRPCDISGSSRRNYIWLSYFETLEIIVSRAFVIVTVTLVDKRGFGIVISGNFKLNIWPSSYSFGSPNGKGKSLYPLNNF